MDGLELTLSSKERKAYNKSKGLCKEVWELLDDVDYLLGAEVHQIFHDKKFPQILKTLHSVKLQLQTLREFTTDYTWTLRD